MVLFPKHIGVGQRPAIHAFACDDFNKPFIFKFPDAAMNLA